MKTLQDELMKTCRKEVLALMDRDDLEVQTIRLSSNFMVDDKQLVGVIILKKESK